MSKSSEKRTSDNFTEENYLDMKIKEELIAKAAMPGSVNEYQYENLKVEENASKAGQIDYLLEFEDYGSIEMIYSISWDEGKNFRMLEAIAEGHQVSELDSIYDATSRKSYRKRFDDLLESGALPEEYRESLSKFLDEIFWEQ